MIRDFTQKNNCLQNVYQSCYCMNSILLVFNSFELFMETRHTWSWGYEVIYGKC